MPYFWSLILSLFLFNQEPVATIERTTCYGQCPYYKMAVYPNGWATYEGRQHVERIGRYQATVPASKVDSLLAKAQEIDYLSLADRYPTSGLGIVDFPMCITSVVIDGQSKTIYNRNNAPQKLIEYQDFFDELFEYIVWEKIE